MLSPSQPIKIICTCLKKKTYSIVCIQYISSFTQIIWKGSPLLVTIWQDGRKRGKKSGCTWSDDYAEPSTCFVLFSMGIRSWLVHHFGDLIEFEKCRISCLTVSLLYQSNILSSCFEELVFSWKVWRKWRSLVLKCQHCLYILTLSYWDLIKFYIFFLLMIMVMYSVTVRAEISWGSAWIGFNHRIDDVEQKMCLNLAHHFYQ